VVPALVFGSGCSSSSNQVVTATVTVFDSGPLALSVGNLNAVQGTYTSCMGHVDGSPWSVATPSGTGVLENPVLTVAMDDPHCVLTLTALTADQDYAANPPFVLGTAFQSSPAAFDAPAAGGFPAMLAFHASAEVSSTTFAADFVITVASDPSHSPEYTLVDSIAVKTDARKVVQSATGTASFTDGATVADSYVISSDPALPDAPTFAQDDAAFMAGAAVAIVSANPQIDAASFLTVGTDVLPQVRTVIFRHMSVGVASYQSFRITFDPPPGP
jgi:hypothetical protein